MKTLFFAFLLALFLSLGERVDAAVDLETVSINMEPIFLLGGSVILALLGFMAYRKAVKTTNRS